MAGIKELLKQPMFSPTLGANLQSVENQIYSQNPNLQETVAPNNLGLTNKQIQDIINFGQGRGSEGDMLRNIFAEDILDYKTNRKIEKTSFMDKIMSGPFRKFKDCNFSKYSAQLSGYQKMACDITGFERGEKWIIHTANEKYKRKKDVFIECIDMNKEIEIAFKTFR